MASLKEYRDEQLEKIAKLRALGVDPYPARSFRDTAVPDIVADPDQKIGKGACVSGRLLSQREHGKIHFLDIEDSGSTIQLIVREEALKAQYEKGLLGFSDVNLLTRGDIIEAAGVVTHSDSGELSVEVKGLRILTKVVRPLPEKLEDWEARFRQRYVDMIINPESKQVMDVRIAAVSAIRDFLEGNGFVDIETPVLQPLYGGASAQPFVTHHNKLDADLYLRIADELYLKRAVVAGYNKVYEIGHDFRNEGIDPTHNPEFTMLEFYWAYADYNQLMELTESMLETVVEQVMGTTKVQTEQGEIDFKGPYPRITFRQAILDATGVDIDAISMDDLIAEIKKRGLEIEISDKPLMKDLLDDFYKHTARPGLRGPLFLLDYPAEMIPLAKVKADDPSKGATMQLVVDGAEIIKAYNELNDPQAQLANWRVEQDGESDEAQPIDFDFIRTLEYGLPPTAGFGLGIDRFVQILTNQPSIKQTIFFPTLRPEKFDSEEFGVPAGELVTDRTQDFSKRIIALVNKELENWQVANTVAHMSAYHGNQMAKEEFDSGDYFLTKDSHELPRNSQHPIVIKRASHKDLHKLYRKAKEAHVRVHVFIREMIETTNDQEIVEALKDTPMSDVEIYGIALYGDNDAVNALTKHFQLWS